MTKAHAKLVAAVAASLEPDEPLSEDAAAVKFAEQMGLLWRFCHHRRAWYRWQGNKWRVDETEAIFDVLRQMIRALSCSDSGHRKMSAGRRGFLVGVERNCRADPVFARTSAHWDSDRFLLGTPTGTIDLRTGKLREADPDDGITKVVAVTPADRADCPNWFRFLKEATGDDDGLILFIQRWTGYCLTGDTREDALAFFFGDGGNGKTVFQNTIAGILEEYAATAAMETFTAAKGERHPTDLAMLRSARLVMASETEEGRAWAEARIKQLTGGDPITARFMRQDFFTYTPQFKLTIIGNHKPVLRNIDEAARRRFCIVPFTIKPANPDRQLEVKLKAEWPGILRWMIEGCLDWQANGLPRPDAVALATSEYFSDQDVLGQWLVEHCNLEPANSRGGVGSSALFDNWQAYARRSGEEPGTIKSFSEKLQRRGLKKKRTNSGIMFTGIELKPPPDSFETL